MLPAIWPGDTLLIERANSTEVSEGDIVLFGRDGRLFVHRVIAKANSSEQIKNAQIVTQGDGMPQADRACNDDELLGKVFFILRDGRLIEPNRNPAVGDRLVSSLVRRSHSAARIIVGLHDLRLAAKKEISQTPTSGAVDPCQN
jgi:hypothetical protein